ncbi:serine/threonine protein kinase [Candidatus Thiomargarita nelsonii]|uniref:Serine/threonine protein kinase n=1 Tax=Candidatus Thiomargarita nelsonii TaxID=1003181 RepID=A0A176RWR7_9GAMM|nr:serine/threonine protein kinase [Candidatus Thiomargarita nelsonii]
MESKIYLGRALVQDKSWTPNTTNWRKKFMANLKWEEGEEREPEPGLVIRNNYRLVEELGEGGMCVVWKAIDLIQEAGEARDSHIAIKFLSRNFKRHPDALKALVREFRCYNRLSHPNILKAHNLDCIGDTYFMVMEFLKGIPLKEFIKSHQNGISLIEAKPIIKDMAEALAHAHQKGIAHLDFKPANVFYDPDEKIAKLIDFGIARPLEQSERDETRFDPGVLGALTDAYASYEMLLALESKQQSLDPDQRDDIYGLACVTYGLLSGKHPFNRKKATTAKDEKLSPNPLKGLNNQQNQALLRALAFDRDDRTPTASQFLAELFPEKKWLSAVVVAWAEYRATKIEQRRQQAEEEKKGKLFKFQIVTVDARGKIIKRTPKKARYQTEDLGKGVTLEMVYIPEGSFLMGSPKTEKGRYSNQGPQHQVTLEPFYMGKYPVTQAQYEAVMGNNPSYFKSWFKGKNRPVEGVSWHDAVEFCKRLSEMTGRTYRLPSEAQWEYAARAGTTTPFYCGETITSELANNLWKTTDVGSFPPNAFGLYDMHGNLWEWCADPWHKNYEGAPTDGSIWEGEDPHRLLRGGSWNYDLPNLCRCANRLRYASDNRYDDIGFRLVVFGAAWT